VAGRTHNSSGGVSGDGELLVALVVSVKKICQRKWQNTTKFEEKINKNDILNTILPRNEDEEINNL